VWLGGWRILSVASAVVLTMCAADAEERPPLALLQESGEGLVAVNPTDDIVFAETTETDRRRYGPRLAYDHLASIPLITGGAIATTLAFGFKDWEWGTASFHFRSEGFFGKDTTHGGMDKIGHAYATVIFSDIFTAAIRRSSDHPEYAPISGSLLAATLMGAVEVFDGFSKYGFSWQDFSIDLLGAAFSAIRNSVPGLRDKIDFRMEYIPEDFRFAPHKDYAGQKYLLAVKLAGFDALKDTPARFLELHARYFARGFERPNRVAPNDRREELYVGIGVNLSELLFGWPQVRDTRWARYGRIPFEYVQVPYTYAAHPYD
jgi:hypothetical protein